MSKSALMTKDIRFKQWVDQVRQYNARPEGMSMTAWCKQNEISVSTFSTRLHKVQDSYLSQLEETVPTPLEVPEFVELSETKILTSKQSSATIMCGNARIEITEDISELLLTKLIGALCHAK